MDPVQEDINEETINSGEGAGDSGSSESNQEGPPSTASNKKKASYQLSVVSKNYDRGDKGYLTKSEKKLRGLDTKNRGYLTNAEVVQVVQQTMTMHSTNVQLRKFVFGAAILVVLLAVCNTATAFAAARLARETSVDSSSGELKVKGSSTTILTTGLGIQLITELYPGNIMDRHGPFLCIASSALAKMWQSTVDNIPAAFILESDFGTDDEQVIAVEVQRSGSTLNSTAVSFKRFNQDGFIVFDFQSSLCDTLTERRRRRELSPSERDGLKSAFEGFSEHVSSPVHGTGNRRILHESITEDLCASAPGGDCSSVTLVPGFLTDGTVTEMA